jgi:large subunit ribosomal protein L15
MKHIQDIPSIGGLSFAKRVGRGGDRGKTSGRGTKGQKARAGHHIRPEIRDMIKKLPKRRGYGKNRAQAVNNDIKDVTVISIAKIEAAYLSGETVNLTTLLEKGVIAQKLGRTPHVKILGSSGKTKDVPFTKKVTIEGISVSSAMKAVIEKAGGTVN